MTNISTEDDKPIKEERVDLSGINWQHFQNDREVRFDNQQEKKLTLTNWSETTRYGQPAIQFDVRQEDGKAVKKILITRSKRLIRQLKPLMQQAFAAGKQEIGVAITRSGSGYETDYRVLETT